MMTIRKEDMFHVKWHLESISRDRENFQSELITLCSLPSTFWQKWNKIQGDVKCSLGRQTKSHTLTPPEGRAVLPMWAGDSCCSLLGAWLGDGERKSSASVLTLCPHDEGLVDWDRPLAFSPSDCPTANDCSCTEPTRGRSLDRDRICLALERLCLPVGTTVLGEHYSVWEEGLERSVAPLLLKIQYLKLTFFLILIYTLPVKPI